jgi:hypothetical protein
MGKKIISRKLESDKDIGKVQAYRIPQQTLNGRSQLEGIGKTGV